MRILQLRPVRVLTIRQLIVYTGFSNASMPSACHSLPTCLSLNIWKSAPFDHANQHFWNQCTSRHTFMPTHTPRMSAVQRCTFTSSPALQAMRAHTLAHSESHIAIAWNAFYADWVQTLSWSESSLEFHMRLKGAMSFQLGKSACQPTHLPPLPMSGNAIAFHSVWKYYLVHIPVF